MIREMACVVGMLSSRGSTSSPPKFKLIVNNSCGELKVNNRDRKPSIIDIEKRIEKKVLFSDIILARYF